MMPNRAAGSKCAFFLLLVSVGFHGCGARTNSGRNLNALVQEKLGSAYSITYNASSEYALCSQTMSGTDHAHRSFKFIVVKVSTNTITNEGAFKNGSVTWLDEKSFEVRSVGADEKIQTKILTVTEQQL